MKKAISTALALMLLLSAGVQCFALSDTDGTAYETAVNALIDKGYISGYTDGAFRPEKTLSRAEACSVIVRFIGATDAEMKAAKSAGFSDMSAARWAEPAVNYAVANGILSGYSDGTFRPAKEVSYAELAVMVVNAMGQKNLVSGSWDEGYMQVADAQGYLSDTVALSASRDGARPSTRGNTAIIVNNAQKAKDSKADDKDDTDDKDDKTDDKPSGTTSALSSFSGYAYGAINGFSEVLNDDDERVTEIELIFGNGTQYVQTKKSFTPDIDIQFDGTLYCLKLDKGLVTKIATEDTLKTNNIPDDKFIELTDGYQEVTQKDDNEVLFVGDGNERQLLELSAKYSVYVATVNGKDASIANRADVDGYRPGSYRDIHKGDLVRAYDVIDKKKDDGCVDVIFVLQK